MFKSPVLWTGKKPDLDWTEPKKTGLSVVVAWFVGEKKTDFIMYTYLATITE